MEHVMKFHCSAKLLSKNELLFKKIGVCLLVMIGLLMTPQFLYADYCLKTKPPRGMPKRCHSMQITVPAIKPMLHEKMVKRMATCVQKSRAESLVTYSSIDPVWELIGSHTGKKFTLVPNYTPFIFKQRGKKCYGIDAVTFNVAEYKRGVVTSEDEDIKVSKNPTSRQFKSMSRRAKGILKAVDINDFSNDDVDRIRRMKCVVGMMNDRGPSKKTIYDYYPVAPLAKGMASCSRIKDAGKIKCRKTKKSVIKNCKTSFSETLWQKSQHRTDEELLDTILNLDSSIARGIAHIDSIYSMGEKFGNNGTAQFCKSELILLPIIKKKLQQNQSIYNCYASDMKFDF